MRWPKESRPDSRLPAVPARRYSPAGFVSRTSRGFARRSERRRRSVPPVEWPGPAADGCHLRYVRSCAPRSRPPRPSARRSRVGKRRESASRLARRTILRRRPVGWPRRWCRCSKKCWAPAKTASRSNRLTKLLRDKTAAESVSIWADSCGAMVPLAESGPRGSSAEAARRAFETGLAVVPRPGGAIVEVAVPIQAGGHAVGAIAGRWVGHAGFDADWVLALARAASAAAVPAVRALVDRRRRAQPVGDRAGTRRRQRSDGPAARRHRARRLCAISGTH